MSIIRIGDILVSSEIITEYFSCDYSKCKGVCCEIGDSGAPLTEEESLEIEKEYPVFSKLLSENSKEVINRKGFFEIDIEGDLVTPLVGDARECAFAFYENDNCFCAMERSFLCEKGRFRKPISCWLYPIRVTTLSSGLTALNLHRWHICKEAFDKGKKERIRVFEYLREPLIFLYGEEFYKMLEVSSKTLIDLS